MHKAKRKNRNVLTSKNHRFLSVSYVFKNGLNMKVYKIGLKTVRNLMRFRTQDTAGQEEGLFLTLFTPPADER